MRIFVSLVVAGLLSLSFHSAEPDPNPKGKSAEELYAILRGPWRPVDETCALSQLWLHRHEKATVDSANGSPWRLILRFSDRGSEGFEGTPEKVEIDSDWLRITLPPAAKGEKRETESVRLRKAGDKLEVRIVGGKFAGTHKLDRVPSKQ